MPASGAGRTAAGAAVAGRAFPDPRPITPRRRGRSRRNRGCARSSRPAGEELTLRLVVAPLGAGRPAADARRRTGARDGGGRAAKRSARSAISPPSARIWTRCSTRSTFLDPPARRRRRLRMAGRRTRARARRWSRRCRSWPPCTRSTGRKRQAGARDHRRLRGARAQGAHRARLVQAAGPGQRSTRDWCSNFEALLAAAGSEQPLRADGQGRLCRAHARAARQARRIWPRSPRRDGDGVRVPQLAAAWLDDVLEGVDGGADAEFRAARSNACARAGRAARGAGRPAGRTARRTRRTATVWAMRLAQAGFGACLADDMGLGKTLQTWPCCWRAAAGGAGAGDRADVGVRQLAGRDRSASRPTLNVADLRRGRSRRR